MPFAGIDPPERGLICSFDYIHVDGSISDGKQTPITGKVALNLDATFDLYATSPAYTSPSPSGQRNPPLTNLPRARSKLPDIEEAT